MCLVTAVSASPQHNGHEWCSFRIVACEVGVPRTVCIGSPDLGVQQCELWDRGEGPRLCMQEACHKRDAEVAMVLGASLRG